MLEFALLGGRMRIFITVLFLCASTLAKASYVEIKINLKPEEKQKVISAFDFEKPEDREIYFLDTCEKYLLASNIVFRLRNKEDKKFDFTIKIRPVSVEQIHMSWLHRTGFKIELDKSQHKEVLSASLKRELEKKQMVEWLEHRGSPLEVLNPYEIDFLANFRAGIGHLELESVGPVQVHKWKVERDDFYSELVLEEWLLPNQEVAFELSTRVPFYLADLSLKKILDLLHSESVEVLEHSKSKTQSVLESLCRN